MVTRDVLPPGVFPDSGDDSVLLKALAGLDHSPGGGLKFEFMVGAE
jgi:hypothetical protein